MVESTGTSVTNGDKIVNTAKKAASTIVDTTTPKTTLKNNKQITTPVCAIMPIKTRNENPEAVKRRKSLKILNKRHLWLIFLAQEEEKETRS